MSNLIEDIMNFKIEVNEYCKKPLKLQKYIVTQEEYDFLQREFVKYKNNQMKGK